MISFEITADMVVNAAGAWAGKLAAKAGIPIQIFPGKGTMIALNHRIINTVINRCKPPSDGDIIVPIHTVAVIGTTDIQVPDPDHFAIEPWEIKLMLEEGEKVIPGLKKMRILRAWAGVRPLYQETYTSASRDISRAYVMLDHEQRDGVTGLVTITSGKWTTYRALLAQLDEYVGVSNTNMHLSAALGRPARVLVSRGIEFRWMAAGTRSPWFSGFPVYRQGPKGDWRDAMEGIERDLIG